MSAPQSVVNICSGVRLNNRYEHTIYFASESAQAAYFAGKVCATQTAYTFLRKSWPLKIEAPMESALTWSYLFFQNRADGKIYYYFINQVEYINDNTVQLNLELDVMQTYLFDCTRLACFVERQHVTDDTPGLHTLDEGLELGELVTKGFNTYDMSDLCIMIMSTINPNATTEEAAVPALPYRYNGVFSGIKIWAVDGSDWAAWGNQLDTLDSIGQTDAIISMWMYPKQLVELYSGDDWDNGDIAHVVEKATVDTYNGPYWPATVGTGSDPYTPRNKKLLCYPFNFLMATDNKGTFAALHWELFADLTPGNKPSFYITGALSPDGGAMLTPMNYKGIYLNYSESITLNGFPTCAWDSDMYKMWLAQNQNTNKLNTAISGIKIGAGAVTALGSLLMGNAAGAIGGVASAVSGASQIAGHMAQKADMDIVPPQAKGSFSSSVNITAGLLTFGFFWRTIKAENARAIDDYFDMYGYKINRVQVPNIHARESWTYVKTIGCHVTGNLNNDDLAKIERIYDNGITFWVDGDSICDYTQSNDPL